jgi:hypothetical protein
VSLTGFNETAVEDSTHGEDGPDAVPPMKGSKLMHQGTNPAEAL